MPAEALSNSTRWPKPLWDHRGAGPLDTSHLLFRDHLSAHSTGARATSETSFRGQAQLDTGAQHRRGKVRGDVFYGAQVFRGGSDPTIEISIS